MNKRIFFTLMIAAMFLSACGQPTTDPSLDPNLAMTVAFATVNAAGTQTVQAIPTNTATATLPPTETPTPKPAVFEPTVILSASVTAPANCRFGPSTVYAGPGGLRTGKILEAIGRDGLGQWILIREIGGKKSCWVYAPNLSVQGDIASLPVAPVTLVFTPNYQPPANIKAARAGDQVQVSWDAVTIQLKDMYLDSTYFIEAWVCSGGQIVYTIYATKDTFIVIPDQAGCAEASRGSVYTTTKEGYSVAGAIPWPLP